MNPLLIAPSVLSADFAHLAKDVSMLNNSQADWYHIDIMDGIFVPNISFGFPVIKSIQKLCERPLDVHLMIAQADPYIDLCISHGAASIHVHAEGAIHLHRTVQKIKSNGIKAGIAINPHTSISSIEDMLSEADLILVMSVNPGFGGQKFIENTYTKIEKLAEIREKKGLPFQIEVDGGVSLENVSKIKNAGANIVVAGHAVFSAPDPLQAIADLKNA